MSQLLEKLLCLRQPPQSGITPQLNKDGEAFGALKTSKRRKGFLEFLTRSVSKAMQQDEKIFINPVPGRGVDKRHLGKLRWKNLQNSTKGQHQKMKLGNFSQTG